MTATASPPVDAASPSRGRPAATGPRLARGAVLVAVVAAVAAVAAVILLSGGGSYVVNARFLDASQIVTGDQVEVGGLPIGSVSEVGLAPDGEANLKLQITDQSYVPLHQGTQLQVRAVGLAGVANRYIALAEGPTTAPTLPTGGTIGTQYTNGLVDLDELIDALDPQTRSNIQQVVAHGAQLFAGSTSRYFNQLLARLSPALAQTSALTGQLSEDRVALSDLISTAGTTAATLDTRQADLESALSNTAQALSAVASEQGPLADAISRAPGVLTSGDHTLQVVGSTITAVRPALRLVPPVAASLAPLLRRLVPTARAASPVLADLRSLLPSLNVALRKLPSLARVATPALRSTARAINAGQTIFTGLRHYGPDLLLGVTNGLGGLATGNYDADGHYARLEFVTSPQSALGGALAQLLPTFQLIPGEFGLREGLTDRCPGGMEPPAPDGSNPLLLSSFWCNPAQDVQPSVDQP